MFGALGFFFGGRFIVSFRFDGPVIYTRSRYFWSGYVAALRLGDRRAYVYARLIGVLLPLFYGGKRQVSLKIFVRMCSECSGTLENYV